MSKARIHCKHCNKNFQRLEWMKNKVCDNPNCNCPEVKASMKAANDAIEKAMKSTLISIHEKETPSDFDPNAGEGEQLMLSCPSVMVINITPQKRK